MKSLILLCLLFVLGIAIGLVVTPITLEISRQIPMPVTDQPAQQKPAATGAVRAS